MPGHDEVVGGHGREHEHVGAKEAEESVVLPWRLRDDPRLELLWDVERVGRSDKFSFSFDNHLACYINVNT